MIGYILIMRDSLKDSKLTNPSDSKFDLSDLIKAARSQAEGENVRPVDMWNPEFCGKMDMVIRADGSWWHEGGMITRKPLVKLFASILRKDEDGKTYLVTPAEKVEISVERAHFIATGLHVDESYGQKRFFFTTNMDETIELSQQRPLTVHTDTKTAEPTPLLQVRGRLEALLSRAVFYELIDYAIERDLGEGPQLGLEADDMFFPLGPAGIHV